MRAPYRLVEQSKLPAGILDMRSPPTEAHLWGELPPGPWVGIVGTRRPSSEGSRSAFQLARELARAGVTVVSGGALGVDSAAHLGAIAGGGRSLVMAPLWWERAYPAENRRLFESILRYGGGYLSIAEEKTQPFKWVFFRRNEALVALSNVVVLGECPLVSGAKNAMMYARRLERPRFVLPFAFNEEKAIGSHHEVVTEVGELLINSGPLFRRLEQLGSFANPAWWESSRQRSQRAELLSKGRKMAKKSGKSARPRSELEELGSKDPEAREVICALRKGATNVELLCEFTSLPPAIVQHQVLLLTLEGLVSEDSMGLLRYQPTCHERL